MTARSAGRAQDVTLLGGLLMATFVAGSAELLPVGLLPSVAAGLHVSVAAAGSLVGGYALGLAVGGPLLSLATARLDRRSVLLAAMCGVAVLTALPALFPRFAVFVAARALAGALQGLVMAAAFATATATAGSARRGRAISVVMAGFAVATVIGLPLGVAAGAALGWRGALVATAGAAAVVVLLLAAVTPSVPGTRATGTAGVRGALSSDVVLVLLLAVALFGAPGAVLTYLMPLLDDLVGVSGPDANVVLVAFGLAGVGGSVLGGHLADRDAAGGLVLAASGIVVAFAGLLVTGGLAAPAVVLILVWGVSVSAAPPSLQHRAMHLAGPGNALVTSLPASAASAGIALGTATSGLAYAAEGPSAVVLTGLVIGLAALGLALLARRAGNTPATVR